MKLLKITTATILFLISSTVLHAQVDTADISASATITSDATVANNADLQFGNVARSTSGVIEISAVDGSISETNATAPQLGQFTVTGSVGEQFAVSFTVPPNLENGAENLPFSMTGADYGRVADSAQNNGNFNPNTGVNIEIDDDTGAVPVIITVGGEVNPTANQAALTYTGTVTLTLNTTSF